ncbi:putative reverse transcriptase domain-containing protein [Tanacetum coccineum]|uniref:Reverse transcriptase domain-containing protein n=1 Tax=Tanacetum coccineum TaxID=301880 RepID=A0ABQ4YK99_9ASTR
MPSREWKLLTQVDTGAVDLGVHWDTTVKDGSNFNIQAFDMVMGYQEEREEHVNVENVVELESNTEEKPKKTRATRKRSLEYCSDTKIRRTSTLQALFHTPSRITMARDCLKLYLEEKKKVGVMLRGNVGRICLTTDTWTSLQSKNYMRGECLLKWGIESNVFTITLDNASANDVVVAYLKSKFANWEKSVLEGKWLHVRCIDHVMNLIVQDGLSHIGKSVECVKAIVKYIRQSPQRLAKFKEYAKIEKCPSTKSLILDVPTHWNSTYLMLDMVSGTLYVTSNSFLDDITSIDAALNNCINGVPDTNLAAMAKIMKCKFDNIRSNELNERLIRIQASPETDNTIFESIDPSSSTNKRSAIATPVIELSVNKARAVMSSASSAVTYTFVYTDSEPGRVFWGADEELSDGGSPRVITPPVPHDEDEREPMFIQPHDPDYVPEPMYPEYIPFEDEHVFSAEEQPLPPVVSLTVELPGYVTESNPEEDPEEYEDDEMEDGPVDYPIDGGEDGDDDDGDSSGDNADDEDEEEEEVEEHLALADSTVVVPIVKLVSPPEGAEPVTPPPSTDITTTGARITVRLQASISLPPEAEVERLLAMPTPPPSPPISLSPPSAGERLARCMAPSAHLSPPPMPSPLLPSSGCLTQIQTLRIASTQALVDAVTATLPSPPLPPLPPSLYVPPPIDHRDDILEFELPPHKRSCLSTLGPRYEVGESSTAKPTEGRGIDYGDTWVDPAEAVPEIAPMTMGEVNTRVTELAELHEHDTHDLYALLEDAHDSRTSISQRVTMNSQRVDLLIEDRIAHQEIVLIVEEEAYASREAWAHSVGLSQAVYYELQTHREQFKGNEGVVGLTRWIENMESVFHISGCAIENQIKFATCTLLGAALTWWNGQIRTLGPDAYLMTWEVLKKKMMNKYYPQGEIKKLEIELWNLKVKWNDVPTYTERFQELTLICTKFVANETEKVDKYISGH